MAAASLQPWATAIRLDRSSAMRVHRYAATESSVSESSDHTMRGVTSAGLPTPVASSHTEGRADRSGGTKIPR
jgi:hypothetical protein